MSEIVKAELISRKEMFNGKLRFAEFKYTYCHDGIRHKNPMLNLVTADYEFEVVWLIKRSYSPAGLSVYCKWENIEVKKIDKNIIGNFTFEKEGNLPAKDTFDASCLPFRKDLNLDDCSRIGSSLTITIQIYYEDETINSIIEVYNKLLQNKILKSDIIVAVGDEEIPACENILSAHSEVFAKMFDSDMIEKKTGRVVIPDIEPKIFKFLLSFIYSGKFECHDTEELLKLISAADKYSVKSLVSLCGYRISNNLNVNNVTDIFMTADQVKETCLRNICADFIIKNKDEVAGTENFKNMVKTNPDFLLEFFCRI